MSAIKLAPAPQQSTGVCNDAPRAMRGVVFGLLFSAAIWILVALVVLTLM